MAKQQSLIIFTGRLGNQIGYNRKGKYFLRSRSNGIQQTAASRKAALRFGRASRKGALIRNAVYNALDIPCDGAHVNRLNKCLIPAAGADINQTKGFRFNQDAGTGQFFQLAPTVTRDGRISIAPQHLPAIKGITGLEVKIIAVRIHCAAHVTTGVQTTTLFLQPGAGFEGTSFSVQVPGNGKLLVILQIRALQSGIAVLNSRYLAADIIGVLDTPVVLPAIQDTNYLPAPAYGVPVAVAVPADKDMPVTVIQRE
ncbi:hypothetical protein [Chitinophaga rhizophila]|uniref:Uncharacterized protein n=1 Tax=Chitinophaga rhizophila TaxID=2866212 RepID=A0ABS7GIG9_9BACT|nr:hypothetical protein [Chitinophaga rhizophila]MBW8687045.1 hypothetical protein [Chitinophaga rhizophila]